MAAHAILFFAKQTEAQNIRRIFLDFRLNFIECPLRESIIGIQEEDVFSCAQSGSTFPGEMESLVVLFIEKTDSTIL
ncbi:hypothetical protein APK78_07040 [Bifidobacterium longum subsp. longum]|nr:hypothetical protein APK79_03915 [Bifidobacterium longum subsp. longum]KSA10329.1 hypothetical protein APK78_07040 [Bifidobacterium longum subsp. longum]KUP19427.1 hypothetical protein AS143_09400 [Bifidobacterium longum subsp. longum]KUP19992.1 hypothetical protein AS143_06885 [Bifidobacterium longum subsp. longum]OKY89691.1 MAG: hypothetical protein BHV59_02320 [Bifidobacterium sp. 56_9_plus]